MPDYKKIYIKAAAWSTIFRYIFFASNFAGQIFLARLLAPEHFGIIALALSIVSLFDLFLSFSFGMAYINTRQSKNLFSSALFLSIILSLVMLLCGVILYFPIGYFYDFETALFVLLIIASKLFTSISRIIIADLEKNLDFIRSSIVSGFGGTIALIVAVYMAYDGYNEFSLLFRELLSAVFVYLLSRFFSNVRLTPLNYSRREIAILMRYSIKMFFSRGSEILFFKIPFLIIGTLYSQHTLGLISQMFYLALLYNTALGSLTEKVAFVFFSKFKRDRAKSTKGLKYINFTNIILGIPVFLLIYTYPQELLKLLWGEKWIEGSEMLKSLAVFAILLPTFNSLKSYYYGLGKNSVIVFTYIFGLICYGIVVYIADSSNALAFGFSISILLMNLFLILRIRYVH